MKQYLFNKDACKDYTHFRMYKNFVNKRNNIYSIKDVCKDYTHFRMYKNFVNKLAQNTSMIQHDLQCNYWDEAWATFIAPQKHLAKTLSSSGSFKFRGSTLSTNLNCAFPTELSAVVLL